MHVRESRTPDTAAIELADGRGIHGFVEAGYGRGIDAFIANLAHRHQVRAACAALDVDLNRDRRVGFAYGGNQMRGYGDGRARELTAAPQAAIGA